MGDEEIQGVDFAPKNKAVDWDAVLDVDVDTFLRGEGDIGVLDAIYNSLKSVSIKPKKGEVQSVENVIKLFQVTQLVMEMKHTMWMDSEKALELEQNTSEKLRVALQVWLAQRASSNITQKSERPNTSRGDGELVRQLEECKERIRKLTSEKLDLEDEVQKLTDELGKEGPRGGHGDDEAHYLQNEKDKLERELRYIETDLERSKDALSREKQANFDLEEDLKNAKRANRELARQLEDCRQEISEYRRQISEQNNQLANKHKDSRESRAHLQAMDKEVSKLQKEYEGTARQRQDLEEEVRNLTEELMAVAAEGDSARMELTEARLVIDSLQRKLDDCERDRDMITKHVAALETQLQEKGSADETFLAEVSGKVQKWKSLLEAKEVELAARDQEIARLHASMNSFNNDQQQFMSQQQRMRDYDESSMQSVKAAIHERDLMISQQNQHIASLQRELHLLSVDIGKIEENNKVGDARRVFKENTLLKDEVASLRDKLAAQQHRYNDEQNTAEQDRQELIYLRSRMDEYERGIYGLEDAMAELRKERVKVQLRDKDIVKLNTHVNKLEDTLDTVTDENRLLRLRAGLPVNETMDTTEIKLRDRLEVEKVRAINKQYESEIRDLEQERTRLKAALRMQAVLEGENSIRIGLPYQDTLMLEDLKYKIREEEESQMPKDPERLQHECLRLKALLQKSSQALSVAQTTNQELQEKLAAKPRNAIPPPPPLQVELAAEVEKLQVQVLKMKYENERKTARIASLEEALRSPPSISLSPSTPSSHSDAINQQFIECLEELTAKEQLVETLQSQLRMFRDQFQTVVDQRLLLYTDYLKIKDQHAIDISKMQKQVFDTQLENKSATLEQLVDTLNSPSNGDGSLRERTTTLSRSLVLAQVEASAAQRRSAYTEAEFSAISQQNTAIRNELVEMETVLKEKILWLELAYEQASSSCIKLRKEVDHSVPETAMTALVRKHALLVQQHKESLLREQEYVVDRAARTEREREEKLLYARIQELEIELKVSSTKLANVEHVLQDNSAALKLATVVAALDNAERQAQLAKSRERASRDALQELELHTKQLEQRVVEQAQQIQTLAQSELESKNALLGTISREEAEATLTRVSQSEGECQQLQLQVKKYKDLADIAAAQTSNTLFNSAQAAQEAEMLRKAIRDLQGIASGGGADHALLVADLHQQLMQFHQNEKVASQKAEQNRIAHQRLSIAYKKQAQLYAQHVTEWLEYRREQQERVRGFHTTIQEMQLGEKWLEKLEHILASYRGVEKKLAEVQKESIYVHEQVQMLDNKVAISEAKAAEAQHLIELLNNGDTSQVVEQYTQMMDIKLELMSHKRQLTAAKEQIAYRERLNDSLENTIRRHEEQALRDELLWEQRTRTLTSQLRDMECRLMDSTKGDLLLSTANLFSQSAQAVEPPSEQATDVLKKLEEAQRAISAQSASLVTLNTSVLTLNAKIRAAEDRIAEKDAQIHELNTKLTKSTLLEVATAASPLPTSSVPNTMELQALQTIYQHSCETIESLRSMIVTKEESILKYQQLVIELRETHAQDRQKLERELQDMADKVHSIGEDQTTLNAVRGTLQKLNDSSHPIPPAMIQAAPVGELLHAKEELLEVSAKLEAALIATTALKMQINELEQQNSLAKEVHKHEMEAIHNTYRHEMEALHNNYATQLAVINKKHDSADYDLSQHQAQLLVETQRNKMLETVVERETTSNRAATLRASQLQDQLMSKEKLLQNLQSSYAAIQRELAALQSKQSPSTQDIDQLVDQQAIALETRVEYLQIALTKLKTDHSMLVVTEKRLQSELGATRREKSRLTQELGHFKAATQRTTSELQHYQLQLEQQALELNKTKTDLESSLAKISALEKQLTHARVRTKEDDRHQHLPSLANKQKPNSKLNMPPIKPPTHSNASKDRSSDEDEPSSDKNIQMKGRINKTPTVPKLPHKLQSKEAGDSKAISKPQGKEAPDTKLVESELKKAVALSKWEAEKKMQKKTDAQSKQLAEKTAECERLEKQVRQLREHNQKLASELSEWEGKYNAVKLQLQRAANSSLSTNVEHVMHLKDQLYKLEEDKDEIRRESVKKAEQIHALQQEKATLTEQCQMLNVILSNISQSGDARSKPVVHGKELIDQNCALLDQAAKHAEIVLERDTKIMELRFDLEEQAHKLARQQARITDLEALNALYTKKQKQQETENGDLPQVVVALKRVIDKLKLENAALKKEVTGKDPTTRLRANNIKLKENQASQEPSQTHGVTNEKGRDKAYNELFEQFSHLQKENEDLRSILLTNPKFTQPLYGTKR